MSLRGPANHWPNHPSHRAVTAIGHIAGRCEGIDRPDPHEDTYRFRTEKLVHEKKLEGPLNSSVWAFYKEDHTLGNLISQRLHQYEGVKFSAYQVPHDLGLYMIIRVSTDGTVTPRQIIMQCCRDIVEDLEQLRLRFGSEKMLYDLHMRKVKKAERDEEERRNRGKENVGEDTEGNLNGRGASNAYAAQTLHGQEVQVDMNGGFGKRDDKDADKILGLNELFYPED